MSRDALKDAFIAGWNNGRPGSTRLASLAFDEWYTNTLDTLNRANPDGWIEWDGSADMPPGLSDGVMLDVRFGSGTIDRVDAGFLYWGRDIDDGAAVTAYRVVWS